MAVWKRKAVALFPELGRDLRRPDYTVYQFFFDLVPLVKAAHRKHDVDLLRKAYGFAEWCLSQNNKELWNSAGVAFYEHLFDERDLWDGIIPWLSLEVVDQVRGLWELMLPSQTYRELLAALAKARESNRHANVFSTGEISKL